MRAMVFAAGLGTRLKPYTIEHPKALVEVGGVAMLERVILKLKSYGIDEIVVNIHHFAEQIRQFLKANDDFGCKIHISDESECLLDTGGGILAARRWLDVDDQPFVVHNADILTDFNLNAMIDSHGQSGSDATILVANRNTSRYFLFDENNDLKGWTNLTTGEVRPATLDITGLTMLAFGGVHIMSPKIFDTLSDYRSLGTPFSITNYYIDNCEKVKINGYIEHGDYYWYDIGKPDALEYVDRLFCNLPK